MAPQTLSVAEVTADNIEAVLAVTPRPEQLRHVNPVAWYVAMSAYQGAFFGNRTSPRAIMPRMDCAFWTLSPTSGLSAM